MVDAAAEDGIRDLTVTGVQTCALPIYAVTHLGARPRCGTLGGHGALGRANGLRSGLFHGSGRTHSGRKFHHEKRAWTDCPRVRALHSPRSEERRVGKEWRSWWMPQQKTAYEI